MIAASAAAVVLLAGLQVVVLPSVSVPACPAAPSLRATTYDEAIAELRSVRSPLVPRRVEVDSARPAGTLLGPPKVERIDGRCNATFSVSNGRQSVIARQPRDARIRPDASIAAARPTPEFGKVTPTAPAVPTVPQPCPAAPRLSATDYDAAVRELASVSRLRPRARPVAARSATGTIMRGPVVERDGDICYATFYVSDGSLAAPPPPAPQATPEPRPTPSEQPAPPPARAQAACPPLPTNLPNRVEAATSLLGRFDVRVETLPSTSPRGQLLRPPQVRLARPRCVVTLTASDGSLTRVPTITGNSLEEARRAVESARLVLRAVEAPSDAPEGSVIAQRPGANSESRVGATVTATIARAREFPVPNMIGRGVGDAERELERFRIERRVVRSLRPDGEVIEQDPRGPTRRRAGAVVVLTVSDGSLVVLPDVTRLTLDVARQRVDALGAQLQVTSQARDDGAAPDTVLEQAPPAGPVERGSTVRLTTSAGLPVPDVIGMTFDAARGRLGRFKVITQRVEHDAPLDQVVQQAPLPGGRMAAGRTIELALSDFSLVKVPDVATLAPRDARATLVAAGLSATIQSGRDLPGARVVAQQPARDASVRRGSAVGLMLEWPPLWAKIGGGLVLLGAAAGGALLGLRAQRAKLPKTPADVTVRLEPRLAPVVEGDPQRSGPDVTLAVRLADPRSNLHIDHGSDG